MLALGVYLSTLAGLAFGLSSPAAPGRAAAVALAAASLALFARRGGPRLAAPLLLLACAGVGVWRGAETRPAASIAAWADGATHAVTCTVVSDPVASGLYRRFDCRVASQGAPPALLSVTIPMGSDVQWGDTVRFAAPIEAVTRSEWRGYGERLLHRGLSASAYVTSLEDVTPGLPSTARALYRLRHVTAAALRRIVPSPESAFITGVLLGTDEGMPDAVLEDLRVAGLLHLLVVSGFNVSLALAAVAGLTRRAGPRASFVCIAVAGIAYALFTGAEPPVLRALLMALVVAGAPLAGRPAHGFVSLLFAATCMAFVQPRLLSDPSFQLSVSATAGMLLTERVRLPTDGSDSPATIRLPWLAGAANAVARAALTTIAATAASLPILASLGSPLPLWTVLANVLVMPAQAPALMLSLPAALASLTLPSTVAVWLAAPAWILMRYTLTVAHLVARLPGAELAMGAWPVAAVVVYYGAGAAAGIFLASRGVRRRLRRMLAESAARTRAVTVLAGLACLSALTWTVALSLPDGRLHVRFLDVGQGDSILITTPSGQTLLVDGGRDPDDLRAHLGRYLPLWRRNLDVIALTHADMDHMGGLLGLPGAYSAGLLLAAHPAVPDAWLKQWQALAAGTATQLDITAGDSIRFSDGVEVRVLHPAPDCLPADSGDNDCGLVLMVQYGEARVLLAADAEAGVEAALVPVLQPILALKVGHHGSGRCSTAAFLEALSPDVAVVSVGENRYGHPDADVLGRLAAVGARVLRTDQWGTVELVTDGNRYVVNTQG